MPKIEYYDGSSYQTIATESYVQDKEGVKSVIGTENQINVVSTDVANPVISLDDNIECPGNLKVKSGNLTIPIYTEANLPTGVVAGMICLISEGNILEITFDGSGNLIATPNANLLAADYIIYDWRVNNVSIAIVNMPFKEVNSTKDYSTYNNSGMESVSDRPVWVNNDVNRPKGIFTFSGISGKEIFGYQNVIHGNDSRSVALWAKVIGDIKSFFEMGDNSNQFGLQTYYNNWYVDGGADFNTGVSYNQNWHFHVVTYSGTYVKWYVDGILIGGASRTFNNILPLTGNVPFIMGHRAGITNTAYPLNGSIDNVQLFSKVLTAQQILLMYNCGLNHYNKIAAEELYAGSWNCVATPVYNGVADQSVISNTIVIGV